MFLHFQKNNLRGSFSGWRTYKFRLIYVSIGILVWITAPVSYFKDCWEIEVDANNEFPDDPHFLDDVKAKGRDLSINHENELKFKELIGKNPNDPLVLEYIKKKHLFPPSNLPYKFDSPLEKLLNLSLLSLPIANITKHKTNGFFIECGANDGEFITNTLGLEVASNWTGLLIEGSPSLFSKLGEKHRKAWSSDVCLSGEIEQEHKGKVVDLQKLEVESIVECFPLTSLLLSMGVKTVDFFSLDVEGHEYQILKDFPFQEFDIKVLAVEHYLVPNGTTLISELMLANGYHMEFESMSDFIFVKNE